MKNETIFKGVITAYNSERGYGFIADDDTNSSYFFHISSVDKRINIVPNKTEVTFRRLETPKGIQAINIRQHFEKIEGEFAWVELPNKTVPKTNAEKLKYLEKQQAIIFQMLKALGEFGIVAKENNNGWIDLDLYEMDELSNPIVTGGHHEKVPNGYPKTFEHLLRLLQNQINDFNYDLVNTQKGIKGEEKTLNSLRAITVSYPIIKNVRLEEDMMYSDQKYSAENDLMILTDRAVFLIEIKNYGGKGDLLTVTTDGRWVLKDKYTKKEKLLQNPLKQITDHIFVVNKFLENNNINFGLPIIPIIALANDGLILDIKDKSSLFAKVMSADLVGSFILNYHNENKPMIETTKIELFKKTLDEKSMPTNKYKVLNYCENISAVCKAIERLLTYYSEDEMVYVKLEEEKARQERIRKREEEERESGKGSLLRCIGFVIGIMSALSDS